MLVEGAVPAIGEVVAVAVVTLRNTNFARTMLACFAKLLVVLVVMGLTTLLTPEHVGCTVVIAVPPYQALEAHGMYLFIHPSSAWSHGP